MTTKRRKFTNKFKAMVALAAIREQKTLAELSKEFEVSPNRVWSIDITELTYFFHPDHLGSASWITDLSGLPVQHLQYKPFGGDYIDQQDPNAEYSERFRFTGKERDAETGYDYFGARYYSSSLGIWLSVDPMSDKYQFWRICNLPALNISICNAKKNACVIE